jgi:hypothetical protein
VSDTVVFLPEKYIMSTTASANRASAALEELTEALKNPEAAKPFLNTGNKLNAAITAYPTIEVLLHQIVEHHLQGCPREQQQCKLQGWIIMPK